MVAREIAENAGIAVIEDKALARFMYDIAERSKISRRCYEAVAS